MADLRDELIARIAATGPLTLAEFISDCLLHPKYGYYTTRAPFGREGDFTTAPEMSQMFGELLGLWVAQIWRDQGATSTFALVEMGPGRGTLMADFLRATRGISGFHDALDLHLIEASPGLRDQQSKQLGVFSPTWHQTLNTVPDLPLFLVANEFFDALPVRQFIRDGGQWRERCVMIREGTLAFGLTDAAPQAALAYRLTDTKQGDLVETCITSQAIAQQIGQRIKARGGAGLIIDYGNWRSLGDTVQSVLDHKPIPPLSSPGMSDITAHIDFEALAMASPSAHSRPTPQGIFLERLGITQRANALAKTLQGSNLTSHIAAHRRLTHPAEMGEIFKAMAFFPNHHSSPPGLDL